ncbi:MAG TPA: LPXTG cell wall anchor domain-containing protein [Mycobacteriales bacterium]|nr:LPXTG cell wall anchor domain-containing protein [Mycobacteriales bacterium]
MTARRTGRALAALSVAAVAAVGLHVPAAVAQQPAPGFNCPNPGGQYPPGQCRRTTSDSTPARGQSITVTSGSGTFDPGSQGRFGVQSTYQELGGFTADTTGNAAVTFTVPSTLSDGQHNVVFRGVLNGAPNEVRVPITVSGSVAGAGAGASNGRGNPGTAAGRLPRTGADHVLELTAAGVGLVVVGGAVVVASRRRREDPVVPGGLA